MELTTTARKLHTAVADGQWKALEELDLPARLVSMVRDLDLYLTGKSNNRDPARDLDRSERFVTGEIWEIYLSDGGYSRVVLQIADSEKPPIWLERGLSLPRVVERWDALRT